MFNSSFSVGEITYRETFSEIKTILKLRALLADIVDTVHL